MFIANGADMMEYCRKGYDYLPPGTYPGMLPNDPPIVVPAYGACVVNKKIFNYAPPPMCKAPNVGKPIYPLTGDEAMEQSLGMSIGKESLALSYNTSARRWARAQAVNPNSTAAGLNQISSLVDGFWRGSFAKSLMVYRYGSSAATSVQVLDSLGNVTSFLGLNTGASQWMTAATGDARIKVYQSISQTSPFSATFQVLDASGNVESYMDLDGASAGANKIVRITSTSYAGGGSVDYIYSDTNTPAGIAPKPGLLIRIQDNQGKSVRLTYEVAPSGVNRIKTITGVDGQIVTLAYDTTSGSMNAINWPDGKVRLYLHEDARFPWAVTGVVDENNSRMATIAYDANGYATDTQLAGGVDHYHVDYVMMYECPVKYRFDGTTLYTEYSQCPRPETLVTGPNGVTSTLKTSGALNQNWLTGSTQPAGSGCTASNQASTYDNAGNVSSHDDFNGNRSCFAHDSSNRRILSVEGLSTSDSCAAMLLDSASLPAGARKVKKVFHPDWDLPTKVNAPGSITTSVYQGQPDPFNGNAVANCTAAPNLPNGKPIPVVCKTVVQTTREQINDPQFDSAWMQNSASLLMDGANGSNYFKDETGKAWSAVGTPTLSTSVKKYGSAAAYFNGTNAFIQQDTSSGDFEFGVGDFTIEGWFYPLTSTPSTMMSRQQATGVALQFNFAVNSPSLLMRPQNGNGAEIVYAVAPPNAGAPNMWHHYAVVRKNGIVTFYADGVGGTPVAFNKSLDYYWGGSRPPFSVGAFQLSNTSFFKGYIDNVRVGKMARYDGNFVPKNSEYYNSDVPNVVTAFSYDAAGRQLSSTDSANRTISKAYFPDTIFTGSAAPGTYDPHFDWVSLLLHADGVNGATSLADSSNSAKSVTAAGAAQISTAQSKFGGSSVAFNGSSSYLNIPTATSFDFGAGDFTVEGFIQVSALPAAGVVQAIAGKYELPGGLSWLLYLYNNAGTYQLVMDYSANGTNGANATKASFTPVVGTWYHVAAVRTGNNIVLFVNGNQIVSTAFSATIYDTGSTKSLRVGAWYNNALAGFFHGYIDELRITKGVARYTANFTPPSQAFLGGQTIDPNSVGHRIGDLQSITEPGGFVTTYDLYDPAGRLLKMTDPKGVVTDISYTPRGWVKTVSTTAPGQTARLTTYSYDGVGQVIGVASPDGATLTYTYDAAHRLTGITDARGNTVTYTLDNMGNRTGEDIKDPSGTLQRSISRSFDALNRVQQVTGAPR